MGDLDVSGRVVNAVFADEFLMKETMDKLIAIAGDPIRRHINIIPGYSAFWVSGEAQYYLHHGDLAYLRNIRTPLLQLLEFMTGDLDKRSLFANAQDNWLFVDWSPGLNDSTSDVREAMAATHFEYYRAFRDGAWLLERMGDAQNAAKYRDQAEVLKKAALSNLLHGRTFGTVWQTNAMAVFSGLADAGQTAAVWKDVLSRPPS
jgi:hypothetical protein